MRYKIVALFSKTGEMKFVSHLDLMRMFARAVRRADLPVMLTQGFNPHPKISISKALKLGVESQGEEVIFHLNSSVDPVEFAGRMNNSLPEGVEIRESKIEAC